MSTELNWLPTLSNWAQMVEGLPAADTDAARWNEISWLAGSRIDFVQTTQLDRSVQKFYAKGMLAEAGLKPLRVALLGSSTLKHLVPGIRVAGYRRKLWLEVLEGEYGMYLQDFLDTSSKLYSFKPN